MKFSHATSATRLLDKARLNMQGEHVRERLAQALAMMGSIAVILQGPAGARAGP
jgi:hypothetical protein